VEPPVALSNIALKTNKYLMARNSKDGKESESTKKLIAEQEATDKAQAARDEENVAEAARKAELAAAAEANQEDPRAKEEPVSELDKAWKAHVKAYAEANPVKYAAKKKAGAFDKLPATFTGRNQLNIKQ